MEAREKFIGISLGSSSPVDTDHLSSLKFQKHGGRSVMFMGMDIIMGSSGTTTNMDLNVNSTGRTIGLHLNMELIDSIIGHSVVACDIGL